jgi:hypothetical protein
LAKYLASQSCRAAANAKTGTSDELANAPKPTTKVIKYLFPASQRKNTHPLTFPEYRQTVNPALKGWVKNPPRL